MPHGPVAPVVALLVVSIGSGHAAWAAKKPSTTTTTLSAREQRVRELRALVGEASAQEAALLSEIADIEARLDELDDAVWDLTKQATAAALFTAQRYVAGTIKSNRRELDHFLGLKEEADRLRHEVDARAEEIRMTRDQQA